MSTTTENPTPDPDKHKPTAGGAMLPSADTVKTALEASGASPDQIEMLLWFLHHGREKKLTQTALGKLIKRDTSTIGRIFAAKYGASIDPIVGDIAAYRKVFTERLELGDTQIVETRVLKDVATLCDLTRVSATIALLHGKNQSGKTTALRHYAERNNHGSTIYVRMPVGGSARMFLLAVARACGISERNSYDQLRDRLHRHFTPEMLLIVDEVHQAMIGRCVKTITIETIRELHDLCGCGVVLCGTEVLPDMIQDERFAKFFGQIENRGVLRRRIPPAPPASDVRAICAAYKLPPAEGEAAVIVGQICRTNGIGKLVKYLLMANRLANRKKETLDWGHVLTTHATLLSWANGDQHEEGGAK